MHKMESLMYWEENSTERLNAIAHQYKGRYKKSEGLLSAFKNILSFAAGVRGGGADDRFQDIKNSSTPEF